ncbi:hypothetical protein BJ878DRAFT_545189 [Calycina marina]|uniref:AMP-dependent synthetase/ligase domain-containing protein n=1 Tax=Calycina marina TaxID=1763456 RepID=A0A9P7YWY9_9HELO|nr:hypothetical protein BJ878DRAFT_545189 [Calycina marina]
MPVPFLLASPFVELIKHAEKEPDKIILRDHAAGVTATAGELLNAVSLLRQEVHSCVLASGMYDAVGPNSDKFIFILAPPGLDYVVAMLTIFSLGAAISPQSIAIRPEELARFIKLARPLAVLYSPIFEEKIATVDLGDLSPQTPFHAITSGKRISKDAGPAFQFRVESSSVPGSNQLGSLFFTSGTSGNQKGVLHTYLALLASARERIATWNLMENDVVLNQKPANWMGGIFGILPSLITGACLETCAGVFEPKWFWERIRQGGVSVFDVAPTGYDRLSQYFDEHIAVLPPVEKGEYLEPLIAARCVGVTGSLLPTHTQRRWTEMRRGKPLLNCLGSTEVVFICNMKWNDPDYADMSSVGPAVPGVEIRIVDGEMRLKSPSMFQRYLGDPAQTEKAFDCEGYFRTGDCAEKMGDSYTLHGRANIDVLHFWGFTLRTVEIENALFSLPYIAEAIAFPIDDKEYQERAAAVLKLKPAHYSNRPDIHRLRSDLTEKTGLLPLKQPTVIHWLKEDEEIPLTVNGKVSKKNARKQYFGDGWQKRDGVEILDLKNLDYWRMGGQC